MNSEEKPTFDSKKKPNQGRKIFHLMSFNLKLIWISRKYEFRKERSDRFILFSELNAPRHWDKMPLNLYIQEFISGGKTSLRENKILNW